MGRVATWLGANRPLRIAIIAGLFPLPVLAIVSAALLATISMLEGWRTAARDAAIAGLLLAATAGLAGLNWAAILVAAFLTWTLALLSAELRVRGSLNLAVQVLVLMAVLGTAGFLLLQDDPSVYWESALASVSEATKQSGLQALPPELMSQAAAIMAGVLAASLVTSSAAALFLGCWLADGVTEQQFGSEFRQLRMGLLLGWSAVAAAALLLWGGASFADDLLLVIGVGFVLQGLAVVHWHAGQSRWPRSWALALYLPLLVPIVGVYIVILLGLAGAVDNGFSLRRAQAGVV